MYAGDIGLYCLILENSLVEKNNPVVTVGHLYSHELYFYEVVEVSFQTLFRHYL